MTEVSFAKSFLAALDSRPSKISPDHVEDPKNFPPRSAYILPKPPKPMSKPSSSATNNSATAPPGSELSLTVTLKSLRNPPLDLRLTSQTPDTSVLDIKTAVAKHFDDRVSIDKIRLLYNKKPVSDAKVLKELLGDAAKTTTTVDFSVMVMGGVPAAKPAAEESSSAAPAAQGPSGAEVLESAEFWQDLKGFLLQRVRDEKTAVEVADTFQQAWKAKS